jgi:hypothetical protein
MTLAQIKSAMAGYLDTQEANFTVGSTDLSLIAVNQVRMQAELENDFEFSRELVTVSVNGAIGGSLSTAVRYGTATVVQVKSPIEVGIFDTNANLRPIDWTTVAEGLERQRELVPGFAPRYPTDGQLSAATEWPSRLVFSGDNVYFFPKDENLTFLAGMEVYAFHPEWTAMDSTSDVWTTKGAQYLMWKGIIHLNHLFKEFVFRQEGNLPEPKELAQAGLDALKLWDSFRYEQFRRHG